ncbi:MAG: peptidylprolyl isomerase [Acidobacteriota bacterium]|nr:peptidylprolyl isomerase [Acidobacteriota bacterium]
MVSRALTLLVIFLVVAAGLLLWHSQYGAHAIEEKRIQRLTAGSITALTPEDVEMLIQSQFKQQPQAVAELASSPEALNEFLEEQLKPLLAIARQARLEGIAEEPEIREQLKLTEMEILALAYDQKLKEEAGKPNDPGPPLGFVSQKITQEQVESYYQNPENEKKFDDFLNSLTKRSPQAANIGAEQRNYIREQWAKAHIAADLARQAGLDKDRTVQLQIQFQQARALASEYGKRHEKELQPTKEEIEAYIAAHPELNPTKVREKAEQVLARAKGGEDFGKLAAEFSEDPGSKDKGGLYENVTKGQFVPQFELAANNLEPGQIADRLVESQYGFHIIKLEGRGKTKDKDGKEEDSYNVRHILFMTQARDPQNPFAQPMSMDQQARQNVQQEKIKKFLDKILEKNPIKVPAPEEIKIQAPEMPADEMDDAPGMPPPPAPTPNGGRTDVQKPAPARPNTKK